jgi:hypothetical protein
VTTGDQQLRRKPLLLEKLAHQPQRGSAIAPALNQHVDDLTFVVDSAPKIPPPAGDPDHHLVEVPVIARPRTALPQSLPNHWSEFQHPTDGVSRRLRLTLGC